MSFKPEVVADSTGNAPPVGSFGGNQTQRAGAHV
jgi:hypothetical protein